jgi:hypothetical protein
MQAGRSGGYRKCVHKFGGESPTWTTEREMDLRKIGYGGGWD